MEIPTWINLTYGIYAFSPGPHGVSMWHDGTRAVSCWFSMYSLKKKIPQKTNNCINKQLNGGKTINSNPKHTLLHFKLNGCSCWTVKSLSSVLITDKFYLNCKGESNKLGIYEEYLFLSRKRKKIYHIFINIFIIKPTRNKISCITYPLNIQ